MSTLAKFMIVVGADNRPLMLDKSMYDSWSSHMELYIENKANGRMILNSIKNGPLIWPTIKVDGVTGPKKYEELAAAEKLQADCDLKATNIVLQGLPPDVYSLFTHQKVAKEIWDRVKLLIQGTALSRQERECKLYDEFNKFTYVKVNYYISTTEAYQHQISHPTPSVPLNAYPSPLITQQPQTEFPQLDSGLATPVFLPGDDPIACLNKAMAFMSTDGKVIVQQVQRRQGQSFAGMANKGNATSSRVNNTAGQARVVKCYNCQGEGHMARQCTQHKRPRNSAWFKEKMLLVEAQESGQVLDEEQLAFLADPRFLDVQAIKTTIPQNASFQTDDLNAYDSDCDDVSSAKAVLMANLSSTVRFEKDQIAKIMGYGDYQMGNVMISRVYYVEGEDLGKLKPKEDIRIFVGYAPVKKAFRIYNKRTRLIMETIHVDFDKLTAMAFEQFSSGPRPQLMTPGTLSLRLMPNPPSPTPYVPPTLKDWDSLFQPMFDEYFNPPPSVASPVTVVAAQEPVDSTDTPSSNTIDQDAPSLSTYQTPHEIQSQAIPGVEENSHDIEVAHMDNDPYFGVPIPEPSFEETSSRDVIPANVHSVNQPPEHLKK
ncbi:retrovirus-related pol polyprotein from transposon TNT 1-94 [Tanacetum coccineum]